MLHRLVYLVMAGTAMLAVLTVFLQFFSDILLASTEPQSVWRFEAAFLLTAAQWAVLGVVALGSSAIVVLTWKSRRTRAPT